VNEGLDQSILPKDKEQAIAKVLQDIWLDDKVVFEALKKGLELSMKPIIPIMWKDWEVERTYDLKAMNQFINTYMKLKWYGKKQNVIQIANIFSDPWFIT